MPRVRTILAELTRARARLATTNWTLYEGLAIVKRSSHTHALTLFRRMESGSDILLVHDAIEREALRRFLGWPDKTASVVDHANLLVAVEAGCDSILSFDDDFAPLVRQAGLRLLR